MTKAEEMFSRGSAYMVGGLLFSGADLLRSSPKWFWMPRRKIAWRSFRIRMVIANAMIEAGTINPDQVRVDLVLWLQKDSTDHMRDAILGTNEAINRRLYERLVALRSGERLAA